MSDYARQNDFGAKDLLSTGNADKLILGADVDEELDAVVTAVASKTDESREGAASGVATLDAGALLVGGISTNPTSGAGQLPEASTTLLGAVEIATTTEARALSDALRVITPDNLDDVLTANAGIAKDLQAMADPGVDSILGWDESANAGIAFGLGEGLATSADGLSFVVALSEFSTVAVGSTDTFPFYDVTGAVNGKTTFALFEAALAVENLVNGIDMSTITITAGDGLSYSVGGTDLSADSTIDLDLSTMAAIAIPAIDQAADGVMISDAGVPKLMSFEDMGMIVVNATDAVQTFSLPDANTMQVLDGTTNRAWTIPTNASVAFNIGTVIVLQSINTAEIIVTASTGVTLMSIYNAAGATASADTVNAGGMAAIIKVASDEWALTGDISD